MRYSATKLLIALCAFCTISVKAQSQATTYELQRDQVLVPKQPYERYFTRDKFGREITFYLSEVHANQDALPLVVYISEGGLVASRVARDLPAVVTHVASLAGGGVTQLFDLLTLARKGNFFRRISEDPEARVKYVLEQWQAIQAEPLSAEKFFFGFAYRRWSTFLASSPLEELSQVRSKIYLAQGLDDDAVDFASSDALFAQLRAHGKQVVYDRVEGADHSFNIKRKPEINGWQEQFVRVVAWYLR